MLPIFPAVSIWPSGQLMLPLFWPMPQLSSLPPEPLARLLGIEWCNSEGDFSPRTLSPPSLFWGIFRVCLPWNPAAKAKANPTQLTPPDRDPSAYRNSLSRNQRRRGRFSSLERAQARAERRSNPRTYTRWATAEDTDEAMPNARCKTLRFLISPRKNLYLVLLWRRVANIARVTLTGSPPCFQTRKGQQTPTS